MSGPARRALISRLDGEAGGRTPLEERLVQRLVDAGSGTGSCTVSWIRTPAGGGSPEGLHIHPVDQLIYVLAGTMAVEAADERHDLGPGSLALFPAGVRHRNWNEGSVPTVHLAIAAPAPPPGIPFVQRDPEPAGQPD